jgi:hypothetical protein
MLRRGSRGGSETSYRAVRGVLEKKLPKRSSNCSLAIVVRAVIPRLSLNHWQIQNMPVPSHVPVNKIHAVVLEIVYWPFIRFVIS